MNTTRKQLGQKAEELAGLFLRSLGYIVIEKNYYNKFGEIDIIAEDLDEIVFVEVRSRNESSQTPPEETVTKSKQNKLIKTAGCYLGERESLWDRNWRIDVIGVAWDKNNLFKDIVHLKAAVEEN